MLAITSGSGVLKDFQQAAYWYGRSVAQGNATGLNNSANCYREGRGVQQDAAKARELYERAVRTVYPAAQNNLGLMYASGGATEPDYCLACAWFHLAAVKLPAQITSAQEDIHQK